jgi:uracil-DNA glycosylase family protein
MVHHAPKPAAASRLITLASGTDFDGWRNAARALALGGVNPEAVTWQVGGQESLFSAENAGAGPVSVYAALTVPREFVERARTVIRHADPDRFDLLYRMLLRFHDEPDLLKRSDDPDVLRFEAMEQSVLRNLRDGSTIPDQANAAEGTASDIVGRAHPEVEPQHRKVRARNGPQAGSDRGEAADDAASIAELREAARGCRRCPLWQHATQTVFGEGPEDADVVFVGEQPGDQEDIAGKPFVGPAGRVFDEILGEAGIDRLKVYVTNAVKHFKFEPRGKRRIHSKPNSGEIQACRWWLDKELGLLKPKLAVALGATAAQGLLGKAVPVLKMRGNVIEREDGLKVFLTIHPSLILRIREAEDKEAEKARFLEDMREIRRLMGTH